MRIGRIVAAAIVACCAAGSIAPAAGSADTDASDRVLRGLRDCKAIAAAEARLACFDKASAALEAAVAAKDVHIVDKQEIRRARRSLFGFTLPRIGLFGDGGDEKDDRGQEQEFSEINTIVASARSVENGRVEIHLEGEDAVWRTTDPMAFPPKSGAKIRIRKGTLGTYFISVGGRGVRGMRIR